MAQKKAHEVESWLARPDPDKFIVLLYGPDRGLVSERATVYAHKTGLPLDDPFTVVRLEADEADENGRMLDEALTVSMFAAQRLLWVRNAQGQKNIAEGIKILCDAPPPNTILLIEGGDLKKGSPVRSVVESGNRAIALPCYADEARELDRLIDETLGRQNLTMSLEAREALKRNLGGDRLATRGELEKLALFAHGQSRIEVDDVAQLTGDVVELSVDDAVDAALAGDIDTFDDLFQRHVRSGAQAFLVAAAALRHFQNLRQLRADLDAGSRSVSEVVNTARPPIFFGRRKAVEKALRLWPVQSIDRALGRLQSAVLETRRRPDLSEEIIGRAAIALAFQADRKNR